MRVLPLCGAAMDPADSVWRSGEKSPPYLGNIVDHSLVFLLFLDDSSLSPPFIIIEDHVRILTKFSLPVCIVTLTISV